MMEIFVVTNKHPMVCIFRMQVHETDKLYIVGSVERVAGDCFVGFFEGSRLRKESKIEKFAHSLSKAYDIALEECSKNELKAKVTLNEARSNTFYYQHLKKELAAQKGDKA
jgi:hypothetical protein